MSHSQKGHFGLKARNQSHFKAVASNLPDFLKLELTHSLLRAVRLNFFLLHCYFMSERNGAVNLTDNVRDVHCDNLASILLPEKAKGPLLSND